MSKKVKGILGWIAVVFCLLASIAFMPSVASILFLIVGIGCLPIAPIRKLRNTSKVLTGIALTVLFFIACGITPATGEPVNVEETHISESIKNEDEEVIVASSDSDDKEDKVVSSDSDDTEGLVAGSDSDDTKVMNANTDSERPENLFQAESQAQETLESSIEEIVPLENVEETKEQDAVIEAIVEEKSIATPEETAKVDGFDCKSIPVYSGSPYVAVNNNVPFFKDEEMSPNSYEYYSALDSKGRCGVCVASVGIDNMPTEERGEIGSVKPTGWNQAKYAGLVDGNYLYNRCHLIAYHLTGENANTQNLITGTRYLNTEGMLPFENMVADYVVETKNHVMYRVSPIFEEDNLLASGVLMEAKSVEDNGAGILFCVYCYNAQPGVIIDYSDGASALEEIVETVTEIPPSNVQESEPQESESQESEPQESVVSPPQDTSTGGSYAVNGKNGKIHIVGACPATGTGKNAMKNPVYFDTYEEAEAYSTKKKPSLAKRKCGNCW